MGMARATFVRAAALGDVGGRDAPQVRANLRRLMLELRTFTEAVRSSEEKPVNEKALGKLLDEVRETALRVGKSQVQTFRLQQEQQEAEGKKGERENVSRGEETYEDI